MVPTLVEAMTVTLPFFTLIVLQGSAITANTSSTTSLSSVTNLIECEGSKLVINLTRLVVVLDNYPLYQIIASKPPITVPKMADNYVLVDDTLYFLRVTTILWWSSPNGVLEPKVRSTIVRFVASNRVIDLLIISIEVLRRFKALEYVDTET